MTDNISMFNSSPFNIHVHKYGDGIVPSHLNSPPSLSELLFWKAFDALYNFDHSISEWHTQRLRQMNASTNEFLYVQERFGVFFAITLHCIYM